MKPIDVRMKDFYESRNRNYLPRRIPVIIRIDGKAFRTYTKRLTKPFDDGLIEDMQQTALQLCREIQGCKFAYTQSDEISLLLTDYDSLNTEAWFDYCQNKIESVSASIATAVFNQLRDMRWLVEKANGLHPDGGLRTLPRAFFDSRSFTLPKEEVCNYFIWRQQDAEKNSISSVARLMFSDKELNCKSGTDMKKMCQRKGLNWDDFPTVKKWGTAIYKIRSMKELTAVTPSEKLVSDPNFWITGDRKSYGIYISDWAIDPETPTFLKNRELIESLI